ncbi:44038_t:CDS:2 [Gigaspora margarita]|uniref:44038_t:CDS:1 n=1 Tax=Gigaspora margarita TaxID=4874 RepID=A0ABN7VQ07_GIGMA|nr:44038_t:CDS:2 [Gigaspora margarita]
MNVLECIDNKPIKVMDLMQRFTLPLKKLINCIIYLVKSLKINIKFIAAGKSNGYLLELMIKACEDQNNANLTNVELKVIQYSKYSN